MAFQEVGIEAVVRGLQKFQSDLKSMNNSLQQLRGEGTLLQRAFGGITDAVLGFGEHIIRVAEVALGVLLRDAILAAVDAIKELISATLEAGNEFQVLELRLQRLNFNALVESGEDYVKAGNEAAQITREQLLWLQKLAAQSPYDATDVANVYTLARSYGFAGEAAQGLTQDILNFAAGMGLGNTEIQRIIVNFGQIVQQGKVTQRELNDLARGAFVPVNDVLKIMSEQTGVAMEDMDDFRKTSESTGAFFEAFSTLIERRFSGAVENMSGTLKAASGNLLDLVKGIGGLQIVKPIFDTIGKKMAEIANAFTDVPERWDRLQWAARRVGGEINRIVSELLGFLPTTDSLAEGIIRAVEKLADWIQNNRENIVGFFTGIADTFRNVIVPFIQDKVIPIFDKISEWFENNRNVITLFFQAIRDIFSEFINDLLGGQGPAKDFGAIITQIMWFVIENKDAILKWVEVLWSVFVVMQVIGTVLNVVGGILLSVIGFVLGLVGAITGLIGAINFIMPILAAVGAAIAAISLPVVALIAAVGLLAYMIAVHGKEIWTTVQQLGFIIKEFLRFSASEIGTIFSQLWFIVKYYFDKMLSDAFNFGRSIGTFLVNKFNEVKQSIANIDWVGVGRSVVQGIANGISSFAGSIVSAARNAALSAYNAARNVLGIRSPSKLFFEIGSETMQGMALGIQKAAGLAAVSMQGAMARVASSAVPNVTNSTTYNSTSNYNLTVNSSAQTEPIVQDFNMMSSLAGA